MIVRYIPGSRRRHRPYACLIAFAGTDGSLLAPVFPAKAESWADIEAILKPLLLDLVRARLAHGLTYGEAFPVFVATDNYGKHRFLLQRLIGSLAAQFRMQPEGTTPRGPAVQINVLPEGDGPTTELTEIAGEPYHDVINARRHASPKANDSYSFVKDHQDMLCRLSAKVRPAEAGT